MGSQFLARSKLASINDLRKMKLLPTIVAAAYAQTFDLPDNTHASNCLFPNDADSTAVFADKFSQFSFSSPAVGNESYGDLYAEGTTLNRQCPVEGSCVVNADGSLDCDYSGAPLTYPCQYNDIREMYAFMDAAQKKPNQAQAGKPRTLFFRSSKWNNFKKMSKQTECPGFGKRVFVPAAADAQASLCGAKPKVPNTKQEWAEEEDKSIPSNPLECTIWNAAGTSTSCAVGCKSKAKPKTLNLVCGEKKFGNGRFVWWSQDANGKLRPAGKRLLKANYWCIPDPDYIPESSGEGSGEGSGAQEIENADVDM